MVHSKKKQVKSCKVHHCDSWLAQWQSLLLPFSKWLGAPTNLAIWICVDMHDLIIKVLGNCGSCGSCGSCGVQAPGIITVITSMMISNIPSAMVAPQCSGEVGCQATCRPAKRPRESTLGWKILKILEVYSKYSGHAFRTFRSFRSLRTDHWDQCQSLLASWGSPEQTKMLPQASRCYSMLQLRVPSTHRPIMTNLQVVCR